MPDQGCKSGVDTVQNDTFILTLLGLPGVCRKTAAKILDVITHIPADDAAAYEAVRSAWPGRKVGWSFDDLKKSYDKAKAQKALAESKGIGIRTILDSDFPLRLKDIPDPPVLLYTLGNTDCLHDPLSVAVIGTRRPTDYGREWAFRIGHTLARHNITVVSGLAAGCDTEGHRGCLVAQGRTVAAVAHGLNMVYPPQNKGLADRIVQSGGCLISEYPPDEEPRSKYFVERDRLQSGLSKAVVVIETEEQGGTMHTVRFCKQQGRLLYCLVHPAEYDSEPTTWGNRKLLAEGALPLKNADDVNALIEKLRRNITGEAINTADT